jgi:hypothetical protein
MTKIEKTVAGDTAGGPAVSAVSAVPVDGHGRIKGITSRDMLISAAIVLTQLVQVRMTQCLSLSSIVSRPAANNE